MASSLNTQPIKRGRATVAWLCETEDGRKAYVVRSRTKYIIANGEKSISDAVRKGTAEWSIEERDVFTAMGKGARFIGILCRDTNDLYLTPLDAFTDGRARPRNLRRCLSLVHFRRRAGELRQ